MKNYITKEKYDTLKERLMHIIDYYQLCPSDKLNEEIYEIINTLTSTKILKNTEEGIKEGSFVKLLVFQDENEEPLTKHIFLSDDFEYGLSTKTKLGQAILGQEVGSFIKYLDEDNKIKIAIIENIEQKEKTMK